VFYLQSISLIVVKLDPKLVSWELPEEGVQPQFTCTDSFFSFKFQSCAKFQTFRHLTPRFF